MLTVEAEQKLQIVIGTHFDDSDDLAFAVLRAVEMQGFASSLIQQVKLIPVAGADASALVTVKNA